MPEGTAAGDTRIGPYHAGPVGPRAVEDDVVEHPLDARNNMATTTRAALDLIFDSLLI